MPDNSHHWRASRSMQARARELRQSMTPAEQRLWAYLCEHQVANAHFRRQHATGPYIVDFFCAKADLVVEIDGDVHTDQVENDAERTRWLIEQKHYRVIRFTNQQVFSDIETVLEQIRAALYESPPA